MKRFLIIVAVLALLIPAQAFAANNYNASVYRNTETTVGNVTATPILTGVTYKVLTAGSDTTATILAYNTASGQTNPVPVAHYENNMGNGMIRFSSTAATVDLIVVDTLGGYSAVVRGFSPYMHKIIIDERKGIVHNGIMWWSSTATANLVQDTGIDLLEDTTVYSFGVEVTNLSAAKGADTLDVGLSSGGVSSSGFISGMPLVTYRGGGKTGTRPTATQTYATKSGMQVTTLSTSGSFMDDGTVVFQNGYSVDSRTVVTNNINLVYDTSSGATSAAGYLHWTFSRAR